MNSATPKDREPLAPAGTTRAVSDDPNAEQIACAIDPVHSTHSSGREKVLEHIFLGDLLRALCTWGCTMSRCCALRSTGTATSSCSATRGSGARSN